jgi:putative ABC transport system substrate-binding protein
MQHLGRRALVLGVGTVLTAPLVSRAQSADKVRLIGFLSPDTADSPAGQQALKMMPEALRQRGWTEGSNLVIEWRWANGKVADLPGLASDLVRGKVEIIVARTNAPVLAAMQATRTLPIVMLNGNFPVEAGLVRSLANPGGNVTGTSYLASPEIYAKHIQVLKELAPRTDRVAIPRNANDAGSPLSMAVASVLEQAGAQLGMTLHFFDFRRPEDFPTMLNAVADSGIKALFDVGHPILRIRLADLVAFLRDHRVVSVSVNPGFAEAGGLASYAPDRAAFYGRTASFVDRILRGAKPSELPVEEPIRFEFVVNLVTARTIGLAIPQNVLLRADKVIE